MLFYCDNIDINSIDFYHKDKHKQDRICSTDVFKRLKQNIEHKGILDPVLCIQTKDELIIEIGEQRLLIAHQLGINPIKGFIRTKMKAKPSPGVIQISKPKEVIRYFRNANVPAYKTIMKYIKSGVINL